MSQNLSLVSCLVCREVKTARGLMHHILYKHEKETTNYNNCHSDEARKKNSKTQKRKHKSSEKIQIEKYNASPRFCGECSIALSFEKRKCKFCSHSCSAKWYNRKRLQSNTPFHSAETKEKIRSKLTKRKESDEWGPYTRIYLCTCKYSGDRFYSTTVKSIHPNLKRNKEEYSYSCRFTFGLSSFPLWFTNAASMIREFGWYSTPGSKKTGIRNINGVSRDHLYSVSDGYRLGVHPSVLRHPANCDLKRHLDNQIKGKNSSITLEELFERIRQFNMLYPEYAEQVVEDLDPYF